MNQPRGLSSNGLADEYGGIVGLSSYVSQLGKISPIFLR